MLSEEAERQMKANVNYVATPRNDNDAEPGEAAKPVADLEGGTLEEEVPKMPEVPEKHREFQEECEVQPESPRPSVPSRFPPPPPRSPAVLAAAMVPSADAEAPRGECV